MARNTSSGEENRSERETKAAIARRIGRRIRDLRHSRTAKLTQDELAARTGRSVDTISALERGLALPGFDTLTRLAEALDVSVGVLFGYERLSDSDERAALMTRLIAHAEQLGDEQLAVAVAQIAALAGAAKAVPSTSPRRNASRPASR